MSLVASANMRLKKKKTTVTTSSTSTLTDVGAMDGGVVGGGASPSSPSPKSPSSPYPSPRNTNTNTSYNNNNNGDDRDDDAELQQQRWSPAATGGAGGRGVTATLHNQNSSPRRGATGISGIVRQGEGEYDVDNGFHHQWMAPQQQQQHNIVPPKATIRHPSPLPVHQQLFQQPHQHFDTATQQKNVTNYLSPRHPGRAPNRPRRGHDSFIDSPPTRSKALLEGTKNRDFDGVTQSQMLQFQGHNHSQQQQYPQQLRQESAFDPFAPSPLTLPNIHTSSNTSITNSITSYNSNGVHYSNHYPMMHQQPGGDATNTFPPNTHMHSSSNNNMTMLANHNDFEYHTENDDMDANEDIVVDDDEVVRGDTNFQYEDDDISPAAPKSDRRMMRMDKEDQTIDSERALLGTPVKKKKKELLLMNNHQEEEHTHHTLVLPPALTKGSGGGGGGGGKKNRKGGHGHRKKSKVIIDNVDEFANHQQQHHNQQQHRYNYSEDVDDDGSVEVVGVGEVQQHQQERTIANNNGTNSSPNMMLDIAAHARKLASDDIHLDSGIDPSADDDDAVDASEGGTDNDEDDTNNNNNTRHYISPRRIGKSKSYDSEDSNTGNSNHSNRNNHPNTNTIHSFLREEVDDGENGSIVRMRRERERFMRTSKSWDDDGGAGSALQRRNDNSIAGGDEIALGGTWGDENTSFFGMNGSTAAVGGSSRGGDSRANNYSWDTNFDFISSSDKKSTKTFGATSTSSRTQRGSSLRASKSWDDDGINDQRRIGSDEGIARWGTWGDDNASLFGVGSAAAGGTGDNVGANAEGRGGRGERQVMSSDTNGLTHQKDDNDNSLSADFNTLEEWDKAEAQWRETISAVGGRAASTSLPSSPQQKIDRNSPRKPANKSHPWSSDEQSMVFEGLDSRSSISRDLGLQSTDVESSKSIPSADEGDDDDDSIFAFGKKDIAPSTNEHVLPVNAEPTQTEQYRVQSPPSPHNPSDIFNKIKSGLKQADKTKNRARGIQGNESDGSYDPSETSNDARRVDDENTLAKVLDSSTMHTSSTLHEETRKKEEKKANRIKFAKDTQNTVHTYWAESEEDLSEIDKFDYVNNDDRDGSVGNKKTVQSTSTRTGKVAESNKSFRQTENDSLQEGSDNDNDTYGDSTIEDSITYKSGQSEDLRKKDLDELILDHVDNAVTAVAATLGGLFGVGLAQKQSAQSENNGSGGASGADNGRSAVTDDDTTTYDTDTYGESTAFTTLNTGTTRTAGSEYDWLDYMRSFIFPKDMDGDTTVVSGDSKDDESTFPEDEDSYMFQQALAAARAIHHVQGIEYDETQDINVLTDIKFLVVTVALPLGLLFQEHEIGVWVSQAIPGGNGAEKGVQHGDQLAAVNGNSSVHTTLDEVASKISSTPSNRGVELTFLRYVGPLRPVPGSIIQQGFEVTDKSVSPPRKNLPSLFLTRKRSGDLNAPSKSESLVARKAIATTSVASPPVGSPSRKNAASAAAVPLHPETKQPNKKKLSLGKLLSFKKKT